MRIRTAVAAMLAGFGLTGFGMTGVAVADTEPAAQRIYCGMEVREHAHLYLARDLDCETPFGVRVRGVNTEDGLSSPQVTVDLRGHTLRGPDTGVAIDAYDYPNTPRVTVSDGRLVRWDIGITGLSTVRSVKLVRNRVGIQCWEDCLSVRNVFARNDVGLANSGETSAVVRRSAFKRNRIGVEAQNLGSTSIDASRFSRNRTGVAIRFTMTPVPISRSTFVRNRVAVRVEPGDTDGTCADLNRNRYVRNGRTLVGPAC